MNSQQYFESLAGRTVAFCGIGRSHLPLIRLFRAKGVAVTARDKRTPEELGETAQELAGLGVTLVLGEHYLENLTEDVIFRTPGMKYHLPQLDECDFLPCKGPFPDSDHRQAVDGIRDHNFRFFSGIAGNYDSSVRFLEQEWQRSAFSAFIARV